MGNLPRPEPSCPRCKSTNIGLGKEIRKTTFVRQVLTYVVCYACEWESERKLG